MHLKVKADGANLDRLKAFSRLSPVFDVVTHGTKVELTVEEK